MISFYRNMTSLPLSHEIHFDDEGMKKMAYWLSRAANTHHDPELTKLLDDLREVK